MLSRCLPAMTILLALATLAPAQPPAAYPALPTQDSALKDLTRTQSNDLREKIKHIQTFPLSNATQPNDGNEIFTGLRLLLDPAVKLYLLPSDNAIVIEGTPDELALAGKLIAQWDRPRQSYRLTYTLTERDAGKVVNVQHVALDLIAGLRSTLKSGNKIPILTGDYKPDTATLQTQFTYLDVGLSFDATLEPSATGAVLRSAVEQSEVGDQKNLLTTNDPIIHQTRVEGILFITPGKPASLGSLDRAGTTHHLDVEVTLELLK